jgi:hypothetical protein
MKTWTASMVEERLEEAANTLRRLPPIKVQGYFSTWPQIVHDSDDKRDWEVLAIRLGPPSAQAIDRLDETLIWYRWLTKTESRLVWLRANKANWKTICSGGGYSRTVAWRYWAYALAKIAYRLNGNLTAW